MKSHILESVFCLFITATAVSPVFASQDAVSEFRKKHPDISLYYQQLTPVAFESYELQANLAFGRIMGYLGRIRKLFPESEELQNLADTIEEHERDLLKRIESYLDNHRKHARPGDALLEFTHIKENIRELGFLILNEGHMRKREVLLSEPYEGE